MKQSYIGSWRRADNRPHWDRAYGRPAPNDFIARVEDDCLDEIIPEPSKETRTAIENAISLVISESTKQQ